MYETAVGLFDGAYDPKIRKFTYQFDALLITCASFAQFPEWVQQNKEAIKAKKSILMYCTGGHYFKESAMYEFCPRCSISAIGIRCEKAAVYLHQQGCKGYLDCFNNSDS